MKEAKLHITDREMQLYIRNELSSYDRQRVELEIQLCEACLQSFIHWSSMEHLHHIPQADDAAEQIVTQITIEQARQKRQSREWIQRPLVQVAVAASITLLLVGSGAMSIISSSLSGLEQKQLQQQVERDLSMDKEFTSNKDEQHGDEAATDKEKAKNQPSSERWLNKARTMLEKIEDLRFE